MLLCGSMVGSLEKGVLFCCQLYCVDSCGGFGVDFCVGGCRGGGGDYRGGGGGGGGDDG